LSKCGDTKRYPKEKYPMTFHIMGFGCRWKWMF
jgi:hypothetical protein